MEEGERERGGGEVERVDIADSVRSPRFRQNRDIYQDPPDKINRQEEE